MGNPTTPQNAGHPDPGKVPVLEEAYVSDAGTASEQVLPLVEETVTVHTREVVTGRVRVRTITDTLEELAQATLQNEAVDVTRVPIDRMVEVAPTVRTENDVVIIPVLEEVLVTRKQLVLKEELHIRRRVATETVEVPVTLRKQRAIVERVAPDGSIISTEETDP
jgi:stress response protein YsnF